MPATFKRILRPDEPVLQRCGVLHACDPGVHESACSQCDDILYWEEEVAEQEAREQRPYDRDDFQARVEDFYARMRV